jgi:hypothetical protein
MISLVLVILAGIMNAVMDVISIRYNTSIFKYLPKKWNYFFNPSLSWRNKWKNGDPFKGEKFFGSSTFLVFTTDAWHLSKTIMLLLFMIAIINYVPLVSIYVDWIIYYIMFGITFELFFSKFFIKK